MRIARPALILGFTSALALAACDSRDYEAEMGDLQTQLDQARSELEAARAENETMTGEMELMRTETAEAGGEAGGAGAAPEQVGPQLVAVLETAADGLEQLDQIEQQAGDAAGDAVAEVRTSFLDIISSVQATAEELGIELQEAAAGAGGPEPAAGPEGEAPPEAEAQETEEEPAAEGEAQPAAQ